MADVAALLWPLVAAYGIWTVRDIAHRLVAQWQAVRKQAQAASELDIPEDLVAVAMAESEPWAQDDMMRIIRERFGTFKDWNRVRAAIGVAAR